ncbi:putative reverse transcriptase domain-containing protein [Tanacetum coccineum]
MKHTNRRIQIPKGLYPRRIEAKLTKKQVGGEWIIEREMTMISKEGTISKFHEYHSSKEEEPTEQPRLLNKYGFVDHLELQRNEFAPRRLPQGKGNMNEMAPNLQSGPSNNNNKNPDITTIIAQQLKNIIPQIVTQVTADEFDGKGGVIALTRWIEKMESIFNNSGCTANQRVKALLMEEFCLSNEMEKLESEFWNYKMVGANYTGYTDRFHELAKLVPHLVTLESSRIKRYLAGLAPKIRGMLRATQPTTFQSMILRVGILTDEAVSSGTLTKGNEKRKGVEETSKQGSGRSDDKRAKVSKGFMATTSHRNEYTGPHPKCAKCWAYHPEGKPGIVCFNCQKLGHYARNCRIPIKQVAPINAGRGRYEPGTCYECGSLGALQDPNVMTEVVDVKKVEVDRIIRNCKQELGTSMFTIDLIPFGHGSFNVIVGMDWLSKHKAEIVCHEKVVRIPFESGETLLVQGERTPGIAKALSNVKVDEPKLSDISVVRDFVEVFLEDLLRFPPQRQV